MKKIKYRVHSISIRFRMLAEALSFGISAGMRYYSDPGYRKQIRTNRVNKTKYKSFLANKKSLRAAIVRRDGRYCKWCNRHLDFEEMTIDHIVPVSKGGTNQKRNLQILCDDCHVMKTKQDTGEAKSKKFLSIGPEIDNRPFAREFKRLGITYAAQTANKS